MDDRSLFETTDLQIFVSAFKEGVGKTPKEFIMRKIETGSKIEYIKYLFEVVSGEISLKNNCEKFDFECFYTTESKQ